ncbi:MAG: HAD hydrolase-like protein [Eubacteriales bacterium]|nr:HAD hydrolase-like protein [Eubacteriales bacterium]
MGRYKLAVFDLDGTILDTTEGVLSAVKYTIQKKKLPPLSDSRLASFIGPPIQDSFAGAYGLSGEILQELATVFRDRYKGEDLLKAAPYEGIYQVFDTLKEREIVPAVATYKREDYALELLRHYRFHEYCPVMHGADHENRLKKQDIIRLCMEETGVTDCREVVMIGDTVHDASGAEKLGVDFVGVTYGFGFRGPEDFDGVRHIGTADCAADILKWIK